MAKKKQEDFRWYCWACDVGLTPKNGIDLRGTMQIVEYHCCQECYADLTPFERIMVRMLMGEAEGIGLPKVIQLFTKLLNKGFEGSRDFRDISEEELN